MSLFRLKQIDNFTFFCLFLFIYFWYAALLKVVIPQGSIISYLLYVVPLILFLFNINRLIQKKHWWVYALLLYWFIIILLRSTNLFASYIIYIKQLTYFLSFIFAYAFFSKKEHIYVLFLLIFLLGFSFLLNVIFANIFGWESTMGYGNEEMFKTGNIFAEGLYLVNFYCLSVPMLIVLDEKRKYIYIGQALVLFLLVLAFMKRTPIFTILLSLFCYFFIYTFFKSRRSYKLFLELGRKNKNKIGGLFFVFGVFVLGFISISPYIISQYNLRSSRKNFAAKNVAEEGRTIEWNLVVDEMFMFEDIPYLLFGREFNNSAGHYGNGIFGKRKIHTDWAGFLNGTGILGFIFFFSIYCIYFPIRFLFYKPKLPWRRFLGDKIMLHFVCFVMSVWLVGFIVFFSGARDQCLYNSVLYMSFAILFKMQNTNLYFEKQTDNSIKNKL